uniref:Uncharacterized protein n=1 Tax=Streptomyces avermitilis TaxID=33903 RepID=A0A499V0P8_STRAX|nr:hypothetical protein SAVMC3_05820 [Streptomyces avermitilis]
MEGPGLITVFPPLALTYALGTSECGPRGSLIPGLFRPTSHKPFAAPARLTGLGLAQNSVVQGWQEVAVKRARTSNSKERRFTPVVATVTTSGVTALPRRPRGPGLV